MRKTRWVFLLALFPALLAAQNVDNTQYVKDYLRQHPTWTVGTAVIAAQLACNPDTSIPCIIVFDPSLAKYATGVLPAQCSQCQWLDYRTGAPYLPSGGGTLTGQFAVSPKWNGTTAGPMTGNVDYWPFSANTIFSRPGVDRGALPVNSGVNWTVLFGLGVGWTNFGQGLSNGFITDIHTGAGDTIPLSPEADCNSNSFLPDDEGCKAIRSTTQEINGAYSGTVSSGGSGAVSISAVAAANPGNQGDQNTLLDLTHPTSTGCYITAHAAASGNTPVVLTVGGCTLPVSTAIGTLAANVVTPVGNPVGTGFTSETFNVNVSSGTFSAGSLVCFAGQIHEQAIITTATAPSGGVQTLTIPMRQPHQSGSMIFQGGPCGSYDVQTAAISDGLKYPIDALGASDSSHLYVAAFGQGSWIDFSLANLVLSPVTISNLSNSGTTTVTFGFFQGGQNSYLGPFMGAPVMTISGASDSAFNTQCTNVTVNNQTNVATCTIAGLTGTHTATSATAAYGDTPSGNGDFTLYPGAEILDVQDTSGNAPCTTIGCTNYFTLEPNAAPWTNGDTIEDEHSPAGIFAGATMGTNVHNPRPISVDGVVVGTSGGGNVVAGSVNGQPIDSANGQIRIEGGNNFAQYAGMGSGGTRIPLPAIRVNGAYGDGFVTNYSPAWSERFLYAGWPYPSGANNNGYQYQLLTFGCTADGFNKYSGCGLQAFPWQNLLRDNNSSLTWELYNLKTWDGSNWRTVARSDGNTHTATHFATWDSNGNLADGGAVPTTSTPVYNSAGTLQTSAHIVTGSNALSSGTVAVTLSGSAVFTGSSTYQCWGTDVTGTNAVKFSPTSGSAFSLIGNASDTISWGCIGN